MYLDVAQMKLSLSFVITSLSTKKDFSFVWR